MWILLSTREAETKEIENNHICEWNQRVIFLCECCFDFLNSIFFLYEYCSGNGTAEAIHCESSSLSWESATHTSKGYKYILLSNICI